MSRESLMKDLERTVGLYHKTRRSNRAVAELFYKQIIDLCYLLHNNTNQNELGKN